MISVAITGANGFLGSWIARYLQHSGFVVYGFVRKTSSTKRLDGSGVTVLRVTESELLEQISLIRPNIMVLADWSGVSGEMRNDDEQFLNIARWERIALACSESNVSKLIGLGSQAELGYSQIGATEASSELPQNNYARAKCLAHETLKRSLANSNTLLTWVRVFSVYGPQDNEHWLIPTLIRNLKEKKLMPLTSCTQTWNYLHVYDLARLIARVSTNRNSLPIIHAANPQSKTLKDYILTIANRLNGLEYLAFGSILLQPDKVTELSPDASLALSIGWHPEIDWDAGVNHMLGIKQAKSIATESFNALQIVEELM